jgi:hypothetical protein
LALGADLHVDNERVIGETAGEDAAGDGLWHEWPPV